jgi:hypothetical protein
MKDGFKRESGTTNLEAAVAAIRMALGEQSGDRAPREWASTQDNFCNALAALGIRETGTASLEAAVAACRAALEEATRDRVPLDWAQTQTNLGIAMAALGKRESGTASLEAAVAAYRAALEERTRDRVPLQWAITQSYLGEALSVLGEREHGTADLEASVAAYDASLPEFASAPYYAEECKANRERTITLLQQRCATCFSLIHDSGCPAGTTRVTPPPRALVLSFFGWDGQSRQSNGFRVASASPFSGDTVSSSRRHTAVEEI